MSQILDDIKSGTFSGVYLIYGEEGYLCRDRRDRLVEALSPLAGEMNFSSYSGRDTDVAQVISLGDTMPFFSDRRVILVDDSGWFKTSNDELAEYVKNLPDYLTLIFCEESVDKKYRLYKAVKSAGCVEECPRQKPETLVKWIGGYMSRSGRKKISVSAARLLQQRIGEDMYLLRNEMEKLIGYTGEQDAVTEADVNAVCSVSLQDRMFDMLRAITSKDQEKAMDLYRDLLALKIPPLKILVMLGRQFNQVLGAHELMGENLSRNEIASRLKVPPFAVGSLLQCAGNFSRDELEEAIRDVVESDEAFKKGEISDNMAVELLIIKWSKR